MFRAVGKAFASDFVPEHLRASGIGWYSTTVGALQLVASLVAGVLWDTSNHASVFAFGALFALVGSIGLMTFVSPKRERRSSAQAEPPADLPHH
jgi:MFS family permease